LKTTVLLLSVDEARTLAHSLPAAVAQEGADVVVIDNASADSTAELAALHGARHLRIEPRRTYAAAINEAIASTGGDAVLLLNADCFLQPGFLVAARARLAEPGVGSVAPKLLRAYGPGQPIGDIDTAGMVVDRRRKNALVGHAASADALAAPAETFGADGAAALYRRETLDDCARSPTGPRRAAARSTVRPAARSRPARPPTHPGAGTAQ
jgi:GT2 family glycosyltransferase